MNRNTNRNLVKLTIIAKRITYVNTYYKRTII
jgi:hypothetical protein